MYGNKKERVLLLSETVILTVMVLNPWSAIIMRKFLVRRLTGECSGITGYILCTCNWHTLLRSWHSERREEYALLQCGSVLQLC